MAGAVKNGAHLAQYPSSHSAASPVKSKSPFIIPPSPLDPNMLERVKLAAAAATYAKTFPVHNPNSAAAAAATPLAKTISSHEAAKISNSAQALAWFQAAFPQNFANKKDLFLNNTIKRALQLHDVRELVQKASKKGAWVVKLDSLGTCRATTDMKNKVISISNLLNAVEVLPFFIFQLVEIAFEESAGAKYTDPMDLAFEKFTLFQNILLRGMREFGWPPESNVTTSFKV